MVKSMVKLVNGSQLGCGWLEGKCKLNITECIRCSSRRELVTGLSPDPKTFKRVEQYEQYDYMNSRLSLLSFLSFQIWPGQCNTHLVAVTQEQDLRWLEGMSNFRTNVNKHLRTSGPLHEQFPSKVAHVTAVRTMPPHKQVLYKSGELILYDYWWSPRISVDFWWLLQMIRSLAGTTTSKSLQLLQTRPHGPKIYTKYHGTTETERKKYQLAATCYIHSFWTSLENHLFWDCCGSASRIGLLMIAAI